MKKKTLILIAIATVVSAAGLTACTQSSDPSFPSTVTVQNAEANVITVESSEEVKVVPDMSELVFAVTSQAADAKACQDANNKDLNSVIDFLKENGVDEKSIQTSGYGLNPIYDWNSNQAVTGYEMRTTVTVSDVPLDQTGTLLSACVEHGINGIERVSYLSSQYDASYQEALQKAVASARGKAEVLAEAGGRTLGEVSRIQEYSSSSQARYTGLRNSSAATGAGAAATEDMAVAPGQISVEARISVDFFIN